MKQIIIFIPLVLLWLVFPLQAMQDSVTKAKLEQFDTVVNMSVQTARRDGRFTQANIDWLKNQLLTSNPELTTSDLIINVTTTPKYLQDVYSPTEAISFDIEVRFKDIIAAGDFWGMTESENSCWFKRRGYVTSEVLMP